MSTPEQDLKAYEMSQLSDHQREQEITETIEDEFANEWSPIYDTLCDLTEQQYCRIGHLFHTSDYCEMGKFISDLLEIKKEEMINERMCEPHD